MTDEDLFVSRPGIYPPLMPLRPNEVFRGDSWSILREPGGLVLEFQSGELADRTLYQDLDEREAKSLMDGAVSATSVILEHRKNGQRDREQP